MTNSWQSINQWWDCNNSSAVAAPPLLVLFFQTSPLVNPQQINQQSKLLVLYFQFENWLPWGLKVFFNCFSNKSTATLSITQEGLTLTCLFLLSTKISNIICDNVAYLPPPKLHMENENGICFNVFSEWNIVNLIVIRNSLTLLTISSNIVLVFHQLIIDRRWTSWNVTNDKVSYFVIFGCNFPKYFTWWAHYSLLVFLITWNFTKPRETSYVSLSPLVLFCFLRKNMYEDRSNAKLKSKNVFSSKILPRSWIFCSFFLIS